MLSLLGGAMVDRWNEKSTRNQCFEVFLARPFFLPRRPKKWHFHHTMMQQILSDSQACALVHGLLQHPSLQKQVALVELHYSRHALFTHPLFVVQGARDVAGVYTAWRLSNKHLKILHVDTGVLDVVHTQGTPLPRRPCAIHHPQPWISATPLCK